MINIMVGVFILLGTFGFYAEAGVKNPIHSSKSFKEKEEYLPILNRWSGDYPIEPLDRFKNWHAQSSHWGYIGDEAEFASFWEAFREGKKAPEVDFGKNIVVFVSGDRTFKTIFIAKVTLKDHVAEMVADGNSSSSPSSDRLAMALAVIPRSGVHFVRWGREQIAVE